MPTVMRLKEVCIMMGSAKTGCGAGGGAVTECCTGSFREGTLAEGLLHDHVLQCQVPGRRGTAQQPQRLMGLQAIT